MHFVLTGFTHERGFRVFAFARLGEDRVRTECTVRADLALARTYGIHIQELPLLCRAMLDRYDECAPMQTFTFTEDEMRVFADERVSRQKAAKKRKPPQRTAGELPGAAWRGPNL